MRINDVDIEDDDVRFSCDTSPGQNQVVTNILSWIIVNKLKYRREMHRLTHSKTLFFLRSLGAKQLFKIIKNTPIFLLLYNIL